MFFIKNEIIEVNNEANYLVLDSTTFENEIFYQIQEVNEEGSDVIGDKTIIKTVQLNGKLYIEDVQAEDKLSKLQEIFTS